MQTENRSMAANLRLYPWYAACFNAHFWMPVFFLYFLQNLSMSRVLRLEAIYYIAVVILEVPSGYFSDRFGRRPTLLIACGALLVAYTLFYFGTSFGYFTVAQVFLAGGLAFNSGTDTSLHYDSLVEVGLEHTYGAREAKVMQKSILAGGLAAVMGGAIGIFELRYAYLLSGCMAVAAFAVVLRMREPHVHLKTLLPEKPVNQFKACFRLLRHPLLAWIFAFYVLMTVLNHIPYEFYQPYLALLLHQMASMTNGASLSTGIHAGLAMLIAAVFAGYSDRLCNRIGLKRLFLGLIAFQTLTIFAMGFTLHVLIVGLVLFRTVPRAVMTAPMNAAIAPLVGSAQRATFLSIQSLAGRLAFSGFLFALSMLTVDSEPTGWNALSTKLQVSGAVGLTGLILLMFFNRRLPVTFASKN
ncbi:MFS transporter [Thalassobacterium sedimentorum]|nr:MFS transporter [Coraliomargarita sp. SDUM461004]